jgi:hypothetical protein
LRERAGVDRALSCGVLEANALGGRGVWLLNPFSRSGARIGIAGNNAGWDQESVRSQNKYWDG